MYTMSKDGKERETVHITIRLTREEMVMFKEIAQYRRFKSMHDYLAALLRDRTNEDAATYVMETTD